MNDLIDGKLTIPYYVVFLIVLVGVTLLSAALYFYVDPSNGKMIGFLGGVLSGLVVFFLTFITWVPAIGKLRKYEELGVVNVLSNRHETQYYSEFVRGAKIGVNVMGSSCSRFVEDFLDLRKENAALVLALRENPNLHVRLLAPEAKSLGDEAKGKLTVLSSQIAELSQEFGERVKLKRFKGKAEHSIVAVDGAVIAGPIFPHSLSKYSPAVHARMSCRFSKEYMRFFDDLWGESA